MTALTSSRDLLVFGFDAADPIYATAVHLQMTTDTVLVLSPHCREHFFVPGAMAHTAGSGHVGSLVGVMAIDTVNTQAAFGSMPEVIEGHHRHGLLPLVKADGLWCS